MQKTSTEPIALDLDAIEARARAVTKSGIADRWSATYGEGDPARVWEAEAYMDIYPLATIECFRNPDDGRDLAVYIAGMDPATTLALTARLRAAEDAVSRVRTLHRSQPTADADMGRGPEPCVECGEYYPCPTVRALEGAGE